MTTAKKVPYQEGILRSPDFMYLYRKLVESEEKMELLEPAVDAFLGANAATACTVSEIDMYEYTVNGHKWTVYDAPFFKLTHNEDHSYNCFFNKATGFNIRFGKEIEDDPSYCELGPEILDLEISVNGCIPVAGSSNCKYCYKNNTTASPTNMTFETFSKIINSFPRNLSQIAFGITGLQTNPDLEKMILACRDMGIIPNLTTVGADVNDNIKDLLTRYCGAIAVSCYTGAKELCYKTIKEFKDYAKTKWGRNMHINMHLVLSRDNLNHVKEVLQDIADKKVEGLRSVVLLRIKPKGRASKMDCTVPYDIYREVVNFCMKNNISYGFDSCSAIPVAKVLTEMGKPELVSCCEPCESSKLSSYINVNGEYWSCSFAEGTDFIKPINVLEYSDASIWWNSDEVKRIRFLDCKRSCPIYDLDGDGK